MGDQREIWSVYLIHRGIARNVQLLSCVSINYLDVKLLINCGSPGLSSHLRTPRSHMVFSVYTYSLLTFNMA